MARVEVYSSMWCPFCYRAKKLLTTKGVDFVELDVDGKPEVRTEMRERAEGRNTVPQIFINGEGIGGCDELYTLDREGRLDDMLSQPADAGQ